MPSRRGRALQSVLGAVAELRKGALSLWGQATQGAGLYHPGMVEAAGGGLGQDSKGSWICHGECCSCPVGSSIITSRHSQSLLLCGVSAASPSDQLQHGSKLSEGGGGLGSAFAGKEPGEVCGIHSGVPEDPGGLGDILMV